jgi:tRNA threonylcarbamoyladenosine biosynthesis protein TsaE
MIIEYTSHSNHETMVIGHRLGLELPDNSVVCFFGNLAAGKTTFIKGLASAFDEGQHNTVSSPTFVYLHIYPGRKTIYHFDLYRLRDTDEFLSMGFDEMLYAGGICCIEWSERIAEMLPTNCIRIEMMHVSENIRQIKIIKP